LQDGVFPLLTQDHMAFEHLIKNNGFNALDKCAKPLHHKLLIFIEIYMVSSKMIHRKIIQICHSHLGSHYYTPTLFQ